MNMHDQFEVLVMW